MARVDLITDQIIGAGKPLGIEHAGLTIHRAYVLDWLIEGQVIVEVKCVSNIGAIHVAQLLTYLRLTDLKVGLIINLNVPKPRGRRKCCKPLGFSNVPKCWQVRAPPFLISAPSASSAVRLVPPGFEFPTSDSRPEVVALQFRHR
jgi:hypothetical protein